MSHVLQRDGVRIIAFNKCGHTSVVNTFKCKRGDVVNRGHQGLEVLQGKPGDVQDWPQAAVTVAYFRHPLARIASVYMNLVVKTFRENFSQIGMHAHMTFQDFCETLLENSDWLVNDDHLAPQYDNYQTAADGTSEYVSRLEEISMRWPLMVQAFSMDCTTQIAYFNRGDYKWPLMYHRHSKPLVNALLSLYGLDYATWRDCY